MGIFCSNTVSTGAPRYDGLIIDPCIPSEWKSFEVKRIWREALYEIRVENPSVLAKELKV